VKRLRTYSGTTPEGDVLPEPLDPELVAWAEKVVAEAKGPINWATFHKDYAGKWT